MIGLKRCRYQDILLKIQIPVSNCGGYTVWELGFCIQFSNSPLINLKKSVQWSPGLKWLETIYNQSPFRAPRTHFSWTSPGPVAFENGQALIFFSQAPKNPFYKISSYQGFTSKQTPIGWVRYHLRTVFRNPRRNVRVDHGPNKM